MYFTYKLFSSFFGWLSLFFHHFSDWLYYLHTLIILLLFGIAFMIHRFYQYLQSKKKRLIYLHLLLALFVIPNFHTHTAIKYSTIRLFSYTIER